jgi:hypothetical protein
MKTQPGLLAALFRLASISILIFHPLRLLANQDGAVPIGGGGNPRNPQAPVPAADLARLKMQPPFMGMTDENVQQKIVKMRLSLLDIIEAIRTENPRIADCLQQQFDANRVCIDFAHPEASGSIRHDRKPECNAEPINIGINKLPCDRLPLFDPLMSALISTLLHEGLHGIQDWRPAPDAPFPPMTDRDKALTWEAYHCREKETSDLEVQVACELVAVLEALAAGNPIPANARGVARRIGESISNNPPLSADQKKAAAAKLLADEKDLKEAYQLIADCRGEHKKAYGDFIAGRITKARLNETLATNTWFLIYGRVGGLGPNRIAYLGTGSSPRFRQLGNGTREEFALAGLDRVFAMELLAGGRKAIFIGDELETGDGIILGYADTDGDGFFEEGTRQELLRSNDFADGVHLARNPANGDLVALNRSENSLLRLKDLNGDGFPDSYEFLGGFDFQQDEVLYLSFSADGRTAYGHTEFDPRLGGVILPHDTWAVARAPVPGGEYLPENSVVALSLATLGPVFEAEPLAGQYFVWANGMPDTEVEVHRITGGLSQLAGRVRTDANGRAILTLAAPLMAGQQLQLKDPARNFQSALQTVLAPEVSIGSEAGGVWLRWPGRALRLQGAPAVNGPFALVAQAASPFPLEIAAAGFFRLHLLYGLAALPLQTPCAGGELLVRQAYSECQEDGFWHVVEDAYYSCPPDNRVVRYRVADRKTEQRCTEGMEPPTPAGLGYQLLDASCQSPVDTGQKIILMICTNGHWAEATYLVFRCLDGSLRLSGPVLNVPAMPPTRCTERPPPPRRP